MYSFTLHICGVVFYMEVNELRIFEGEGTHP